MGSAPCEIVRHVMHIDVLAEGAAFKPMGMKAFEVTDG